MARTGRENPFVEIQPVYRHILIAYFLIWRMLPDTVLLFRSQSDSSLVLGLTLLAQLSLDFLLLLPFLLRRIGNLPMGWLNPLVFTAMLILVREIVKQPLDLFAPFTVWIEDPVRLNHRLLIHWTLEATQWVNLKVIAWSLVGTLTYYLAFAGFNIGGRRDESESPRRTVPDMFFIGIWLALLVSFVVLIGLGGGLAQHFAALGGGRFGVRENVGALLVLIQFMPYLMILWYLHRPEVIRSPVFWALLVVTLAVQFLAIGSRSNVIMPLVALIAAWIYQNKKVPGLSVLLLAVFSIVALTLLGDLRRSAGDVNGTMSVEAIANLDPISVVAKAQTEVSARRSQSGVVAIAALVPRYNAFLWGETYVGGIAFFIPRAIWNDKPRGAGAYVNAVLFQKRKDTSGFRGASFPPSAEGEAYWNFGWFGIVFIFALFGMFHRYLAEKVMERPRSPEPILMLLVGTVMFESPQTDSFVSFIQIALLVLGTTWAIRTFGTPERKEPQQTVTGPVRDAY